MTENPILSRMDFEFVLFAKILLEIPKIKNPILSRMDVQLFCPKIPFYRDPILSRTLYHPDGWHWVGSRSMTLPTTGWLPSGDGKAPAPQSTQWIIQFTKF